MRETLRLPCPHLDRGRMCERWVADEGLFCAIVWRQTWIAPLLPAHDLVRAVGVLPSERPRQRLRWLLVVLRPGGHFLFLVRYIGRAMSWSEGLCLVFRSCAQCLRVRLRPPRQRDARSPHLPCLPPCRSAAA